MKTYTQEELDAVPECEEKVALWQEEDEPTSVTDSNGVTWMLGWHGVVFCKRRLR